MPPCRDYKRNGTTTLFAIIVMARVAHPASVMPAGNIQPQNLPRSARLNLTNATSRLQSIGEMPSATVDTPSRSHDRKRRMVGPAETGHPRSPFGTVGREAIGEAHLKPIVVSTQHP